MGKENMEITYEQAINCNKNLKEFMRITDKTSEYKFLEDNYIALDMAIQALDVWNKMFKSYEALTAKIESEDDISHATERIDKWCIEQLRGIIGDYYADRIINEKSELYSHTIKYNNDDETFEFVTSIDEMRDATPEEQEAIDKYIKSISKPTGINIFDFYEDDEKSCNNCKHHLKFMCKNWETCHDYSDWELEELDFVQPKKKIPCTIKVQADGEYISKDTAIDDITTGLCEEIACSECPFDKPDIICKVQKWLRQLPSVAIPPEHDGCEDAISRQAIKEQMIKYGFHAPDMTVTEFVEDLPSVNPQEPRYCDRNICLRNEYNGIGCSECEVTKSQEQKTEWIPMSERMPEEKQDVLACFYNGDGNYKLMVSCRTDYNYWIGVGRTGDMVAWMPLPKPYEPQERSDKE